MTKRTDYKKLVSKIPHKIQVLNKVWYDILFQREILAGKNETPCYGITVSAKKQIILEQGMTDKQTVHVYLHELIHCFSDECGASLTENQVLAMEKCFLYVLKEGNIFKND